MQGRQIFLRLIRKARPTAKCYIEGAADEPAEKRVSQSATEGGALLSQAELGKVDPLPRLLAATARGDRAAFRQLYQLSSPRLYAVALRLLRRKDLAEDALQESYVAIWRKAGQFRPERGEPLAWMGRIVRNRAIDRLRAERPQDRSESIDAVAETALADPDFEANRPDRAGAALRGCLDKLKVEQRRTIILAYYYGMTHDELAAQMNVPLGTVKSWIRRGLLQLKDQLG